MSGGHWHVYILTMRRIDAITYVPYGISCVQNRNILSEQMGAKSPFLSVRITMMSRANCWMVHNQCLSNPAVQSMIVDQSQSQVVGNCLLWHLPSRARENLMQLCPKRRMQECGTKISTLKYWLIAQQFLSFGSQFVKQ